MPIKLVPPRPGKTPYWYARGSHVRVRVNRSTGTIERRAAKRVRDRWEREIERGEYRHPQTPEPIAEGMEPSFAVAALAYLRAGGERQHLSRIIEMTGPHALRDLPLSAIDQLAIDNAADALYPKTTAQTKNRQFYTPVSAVLKRAGVEKKIKRPKGWRGKKSTSWLEPGQAFALFNAADAIDREFGLLCRTLLYTGMRLGECLAIRLGHLDLERAVIYLPETKNGEARSVHLPPTLIAAFRNQPPRPNRWNSDASPLRGQTGRNQDGAGVPFLERHGETRLFRFHNGGRLRSLLIGTMVAAKLSFPRRQRGFHIFCHTYGTWMHRYGNLDNFGLTRTERWKDPRSAERYLHTQVNEEARRADLMPVEQKATH